jgi:DNA repair exonuclease SbcCD nuclease subunit
VIVISDECPRELAKLGVEIIGAPFYAKKPAPEPVGTLISNLDHQGEVDKGVFRIIVGHGQVESVSYDSGDSEDNSESRIEKSILEKAVESGRIGYIALGDRHSVTKVGPSGRIFYSGAIQATDFREIKPNYVLIVEVSDNHGVEVTERTVGKWNFLEKEVEINSQEDVDHLSSWLDNQDNKSRCVVKLVPQGSISLAVNFALEDVINNARDTFAGVIFSKGRNELRVLPNDSDQQSLELTGYAHSAYQELLEIASSQEEDTSLDESKESNTVLDALKLLHSIVNHEELDRVVI